MTKFEEGLKEILEPSLYAVEAGIPNIENETQELITQIKALTKKELVPEERNIYEAARGSYQEDQRQRELGFNQRRAEILNRIGG